MSKPKLIFYGGVGATTGSNIMLDFQGKKILVDCGLLQGSRLSEEKNFQNFHYDPAEVDFLIITHAHMDHIGRVPKLVRDGFRGQIISTHATCDLARPMLEDAYRVMLSRHQDKVLFELKDIEQTFNLWSHFDYREKVDLFENCYLLMQDAGHVLGSAICNITCGLNEEARTIAFTGDLGNSPSPLLPDTTLPVGIDYLVMESVYGDRNHENREDRRQKLKQAILSGIQKSGAVVIPAFSIERTQVLLYEINNMVEDGEIPSVPVFLDSPLAEKVTKIYQKYQKDFKVSVREEIKSGDDIFDFPKLQIVGRATESAQIEKIPGAKIILSGSGMSEGGRVVNHEVHFLPDPKATIILVGYQSVGSLGRQIQDGSKEVIINKQKVTVRATIVNITGYSSHKDSEHLLEFVEEVNNPLYTKRGGEKNQFNSDANGQAANQKRLLKVFVIMGEPKSSLFLVQRIRDYLDIEAVYPEERKGYELN